MPAATGGCFADRLASAVESRRSQLVVGLDPDPAALWGAAVAAPAGGGSPSAGGDVAAATADAVERHCLRVVDAVGAACVAVKLQVACFERLGAPGWSALAATVRGVQEAGLIAVVDAKRGDVPVTARAYAQGLVGETVGPYGPVPGLGADAFTVNPLLGTDSLEPFIEAAAAAGAGCFCLVHTSNPGAAELQDAGPPGAPLHETIARLVDALARGQVGTSGLADVGAVVGATRPELVGRLRQLMPHAVFLLPGVGAQGGAVETLAPAFRPHPAAGLVAASRSIVDAYRARGGSPEGAAATAAEELRDAAWKVSAAESKV
jgi:orotidine-5'-phosphate decarboxylase